MQCEGGAALLGSPVYGSDDFYESFVCNKVKKVLQMQAHLEDMDDPRIELLLLQWCLSQCKLNHLFQTIPPAKAQGAFKSLTLAFTALWSLSYTSPWMTLHGSTLLFLYTWVALASGKLLPLHLQQFWVVVDPLKNYCVFFCGTGPNVWSSSWPELTTTPQSSSGGRCHQ